MRAIPSRRADRIVESDAPTVAALDELLGDRSRSMRGLVLGLIAVALLAFAPSAAAGKPVHDVFPVAGLEVAGMAVDPTSGDVLATDPFTNIVERFDADGASLGQFGADQLSGPGQIAVAADGTIYVADQGNNRIAKLTSVGAFDSAIGATAPGGLSAPQGVAFGPDGTVYVADTLNNRIVTFDSTGAFVDEFPLADIGTGAMLSPTDIAVDSTGRMYVAGTNTGFSPVVERFAADGTFEATVTDPTLLYSFNVAVNRANDHALITAQSFGDHIPVIELDPTGATVDSHGPESESTAVAVNEATGRIYTAISGPQVLVAILDEPQAPTPTASIDPVTTVGTTTASLSGSVNSNGDIGTGWRFEASSDGGTTWTHLGGGSVPEGDSTTLVSAEATGLEPNKEYQARLVASKGFGIPDAADTTTFTTNAAAPLVRALAAGNRTDTAARLGADVNPQNSSTTFYVEYTLESDVAYVNSSRVPAAPVTSEVGDGGEFTAVSELVTGLQPSTTYRFRVVAINSTGTTISRDSRFTTRKAIPEPPDGRGYEMVSPLDKNGGNVDPYVVSFDDFTTFAASPSGERVAYGSTTAFGVGVASGPLGTQYRSVRTSNGWVTQSVSPPLDTVDATDGNTPRVYELSEDLDRVLVQTNRPLTAGAGLLNGFWGLYRADLPNALGAPHYQLVSSPSSPLPPPGEGQFINEFRVAAGSSNLSSVVFETTSTELVPGGGVPGLYQWTNGELRAVAILPDGSPAPHPAVGARRVIGMLQHPGNAPVSDDGSRVFFTPADSVVYVREHGAFGSATRVVSASERAGDESIHPAVFEAAEAAGGSQALFTSVGKLTDDATACNVPPPTGPCDDLYLWSANPDSHGNHLVDLTTSDPDGAGVVAVSEATEDLSRVYFVANGQLAEGAVEGGCDRNSFSPPEAQCNLYVWTRAEGIKLVAVIRQSDQALWSIKRHGLSSEPLYRPARVSADGSRFLFEASTRLTAADNDRRTQVYLYDYDEDALRCVSCSTLSEPATAAATLSPDARAPSDLVPTTPKRLPANLSADGERAFFTTRQRLVAEDTNGKGDVYMWKAGELSLISSGSANSDAEFLAASASGDDVFFTTRQRLVASDVDDQIDLYDARVGGGFPEQQGPPDCTQDDCQGPPSAQPEGRDPASQSLVERRPRGSSLRAAFSARRLTADQLGRLARGRAVSLRVRVNRPGRVSAVATARFGGKVRKVASATKTARRATAVSLELRLSGPARRYVARARRLSIALRIRFGGVDQPRRATLNLRLPASSPAAHRVVGGTVNTDGRTSR